MAIMSPTLWNFVFKFQSFNNRYDILIFQLLGELYEDREYLEKLLNDSRELHNNEPSCIGKLTYNFSTVGQGRRDI